MKRNPKKLAKEGEFCVKIFARRKYETSEFRFKMAPPQLNRRHGGLDGKKKY